MKFLKIKPPVVLIILFFTLFFTFMPNHPSEEESQKTEILFEKHKIEMTEYLHNINFSGEISCVENNRGSLKIKLKLDTLLHSKNFSNPYLKVIKGLPYISLNLFSTYLITKSDMYLHLIKGGHLTNASGSSVIEVKNKNGLTEAFFTLANSAPLTFNNNPIIDTEYFGKMSKINTNNSNNEYTLLEIDSNNDTISKTNYRNETQNGRIQYFSKRKGAKFLLLNGSYKDGKKDGLWTWYYDINKIESQIDYKKGEPISHKVSFQYLNQ